MTTFRVVHPKGHFLKRHSLSLVAGGVLSLWIVLYYFGDPKTHLGAFYGNAVADWSGLFVTVVGTKFFFESHSMESREPVGHKHGPIAEFFHQHSLSIFLVITGAGWAALYAAFDANGKWNQVVGNIVSEWTQMLGLVLMTKRLIEPGSKESREQ